MFDEQFPRVLVVNGESIAAASATGFTLRNLFAEWPSDELAQIYTSSGPHERKSDYEYHLRPGDRRGLKWLGTRSGSSQVLMTGGNYARKSRSRDVSRFIGNAIRPTLRKWLDLVPYKLPDHVEKAIVQFRPEIVYTLLGGIQISALALRCAELCNARIVPHFMDDWMSTAYAGRPDLVIQRLLLLRTARRVIRAAPVGMTISDLMAAEYTSTYGVPFYSFMNCVSVPVEMRPEAAFDPAVGPRLVYVGGLHLDRWRSLKEIGEALERLNSEGIPGKLFVYAPAEHLSEFSGRLAGPSMNIAGSLAQGQVANALTGGHILVHVESFEKTSRQYTRLSMSTKIPQYLTAGRPLLCYGPGEVASCRFVEKNKCGLVVGVQDQSELVAALRRILQDADLRTRLGAKAWATAKLIFDAPEVRERFRSVIAKAAWGSPTEQEAPGLRAQLEVSEHN
jgi:hypothetical protein